MIKFDYAKAGWKISNEEIENIKPALKAAHDTLHNKTGAGNDYLGWVDLPVDYDKEEFKRIKAAAEKIKAGDMILVRPGDRIPLDGIVVEGNSQLDTSAVTGEPVPRIVEPGEEIS